jgi:hypothetical protein
VVYPRRLLERSKSRTGPYAVAPENVHPLARLALTIDALLAVGLMAAGVTDVWREWSALLLFCLGPGCAVMRRMRPLNGTATYGLALALSLTISCGIAVVSVWVREFHSLALLVGDALICLYGLWWPRSRKRSGREITSGDGLMGIRSSKSSPASRQEQPRHSKVHGFRSRWGGIDFEVWLPTALLLSGALLWKYSLSIMNVANLGDYGLLPRFPITYPIGLAVIAASFFFSLTRSQPRSWLLGIHIAALIVFLAGTAPSLFLEPRYPWVYKHFGVVKYIQAHGSVSSNIDIYQNWPGFFAGAAWLSNIMGVEVTAFAGWAQVFFNLTYFLELSFVYQVLHVPFRIRWVALFIFFSANWVGQDYFSPQAFSFTLALALFGVTIAWLRADFRGPATWIVRKVVRVRGKAARGIDGVFAQPGWTAVVRRPWNAASANRLAPLLIAFGLFAMITISHQLSPYMVAVAIGAVTLLDGIKPRWLVIAMFAIAAAFLALHYSFIVKNFGPLVGGGDPIQNAKSNGQGTTPSAGVAFVADTTRLLTGSIWLLGVIGFIRRLRNGQRDLLVGAMAISPFFVLGGQSYGGEAIFRVYLFSLPWFALMAAYVVLPKRFAVTAWFIGLRVAGLVALMILFLSSYFGLEQIYEVTPAEVAGATYFYTNAPVGAVLFGVDQGLPVRSTGRYYLYSNPAEGDVIPTLAEVPKFSNHILGPSDMPAVDAFIDSYDRPTFVVFTNSAKVYAHGYGQLPDGSYDSLGKAFAADPNWKLWFQDKDVKIYEQLDKVPHQTG